MRQIELDLVPSADALNDLKYEYKHASQKLKHFMNKSINLEKRWERTIMRKQSAKAS